MGKDNFISYLSMGHDTFFCDFDVKNEEQIEVIVEENLLKYLNDYTIKNFNEKTKIIKLKEKLGSTLYPKLLILKRNLDIARETNFNDDTQIQANLLNLEFDNLINNQQFLKDFLDKLSAGFKAAPIIDNGGNHVDNEGILDPRNWEKEVHVVDIEDGFDIGDFIEVGIPDLKPLTHNVYFIHSTDLSKIPNEKVYQFVNFKKIEEPFSVRFFIDKRICLYKNSDSFKKKISAIFATGSNYLEEFIMYADKFDVIAETITDYSTIINNYKDIYYQLGISDKDIFMGSSKYYLDPKRGF